MTKQALISPGEVQTKISGWVNPTNAITENIANSARIAEVRDSSFSVAPPMFWVECPDDTVADQGYYDMVTNEIKPFPEPPARPVPTDQPVVSGAQPL